MWDGLGDRTLLGNGITGLIDSTQFTDLISRTPIKVYNVLSLLALVRANVGITILPRLSLPPSEHGLCFVALKDPMARRTVGILSRSSEAISPATEAFARELCRAVMSIGGELGLELDRDNLVTNSS
jgi:DNA-binding transcriptional LysR family regulator